MNFAYLLFDIKLWQYSRSKNSLRRIPYLRKKKEILSTVETFSGRFFFGAPLDKVIFFMNFTLLT